jgi:hypothetical protein
MKRRTACARFFHAETLLGVTSTIPKPREGASDQIGSRQFYLAADCPKCVVDQYREPVAPAQFESHSRAAPHKLPIPGAVSVAPTDLPTQKAGASYVWRSGVGHANGTVGKPFRRGSAMNVVVRIEANSPSNDRSNQ